MKRSLNLLFVCSRNQWRSPTAEQVWKNKSGFNVRSAGTSKNAKRTISPADIRWADFIFVMERKHKNRLKAAYARMLEHKPLYELDIPDEYQFMDPTLISELEKKISTFLNNAVNL